LAWSIPADVSYNSARRFFCTGKVIRQWTVIAYGLASPIAAKRSLPPSGNELAGCAQEIASLQQKLCPSRPGPPINAHKPFNTTPMC